jgi:hypothetical protein
MYGVLVLGLGRRLDLYIDIDVSGKHTAPNFSTTLNTVILCFTDTLVFKSPQGATTQKKNMDVSNAIRA